MLFGDILFNKFSILSKRTVLILNELDFSGVNKLIEMAVENIFISFGIIFYVVKRKLIFSKKELQIVSYGLVSLLKEV